MNRNAVITALMTTMLSISACSNSSGNMMANEASTPVIIGELPTSAPMHELIETMQQKNPYLGAKMHIASNWNIANIKAPENGAITFRLRMQPNGTVQEITLADKNKERYKTDIYYRAWADSAFRAVMKSSPLKHLPPDKYDAWKDIELTFLPEDVLF